MTKPPLHSTRESWLSAAVSIFRPWFVEQEATLPATIRVSTGFPSVRALSDRNRAIGQCWPPDSSADGSVHVFISPVLGDASRVADVLIHELCHAALPKDVGHKGAFKRLAVSLGLTGKMTATDAGPELKKKLTGVLKTLGPYPHAMLDPKKSPVKKQGTRLLKVEATDCCKYVARITRKWVDAEGWPKCPHGEDMLQVQ